MSADLRPPRLSDLLDELRARQEEWRQEKVKRAVLDTRTLEWLRLVWWWALECERQALPEARDEWGGFVDRLTGAVMALETLR